MFLKALTLKGFKSFAETTELEFEPGVTVVVGPNGSGKSNVVDAIGWVLGAQAPSTVRSQKMDDVIFAGTSKRPPLGRAEVALTLDNSGGLLPIELSEVTVTRTLWRSGDSEYAINGVSCRLLDIQELFSDTGVGRQQHVIVGQGQIDAMLSARPEDRRMVIEEAAGILKHRKRKERSERRLTATEGNLQRLQDLQREVRRQLRPLERQAEAARRHGSLVFELRALQVHIIGRELATLQRRLAEANAVRSEVAAEERALRSRLADLDAAILVAETELQGIGGGDLGPAFGRVEALREKAKGLLALLGERQRGLERERAAFVDHAVLASLNDDVAQLQQELGSLDGAADELAPLVVSLEADEAQLAEDRHAFDAMYADSNGSGNGDGDDRIDADPADSTAAGSGANGAPAGARLRSASGRAAEVRGELAALKASSERSSSNVARARSRVEQQRQRSARLEDEVRRLSEAAAGHQVTEGELIEAITAAELARTVTEGSAQEAEERYRAAEAERHALVGRVDALALALDDARSRAGTEQLADVEGMVGTLLDLVEIDPGWEAAVEAACGEALTAVVVSSVAAGRHAVQALAKDDLPGSVLAVGSGVTSTGSAPPVGEPVRAHVKARDAGLEPLLDGLLGNAVAVTGEPATHAAVDAALAHPDAVVVTRSGGRFARTGWRAVTATTGATGAALESARAMAETAEEAVVAARVAHEEATEAARVARQAHDVAQRTLEEHRREMTAVAERRERAGRDRGEADAEIELLTGQLAEAEEQLAREQARIEELEAVLPGLEAAQAEARELVQEMAQRRHALDQRAGLLVARRKDLEVKQAGIADRRQFLTQRLREVEGRLERTSEAWQAAEARRHDLDHTGTVLDRLTKVVSEQLAVVESQLTDLQARRDQQNEMQRQVVGRLDELRRSRLEAERKLEEGRERGRRAEIDEAEVRLRLEQTTETCRTQLDVEPHAAINAPVPEVSDGTPPAARVRELERELKLMGPINPLALEEFEALQERHDFLQGQLDDVRAGRKDLQKVIRAVDDEIARIFAAAFADVNENFVRLFSTLFPGGQGQLRLTDSEHLLDAGIEIEAKPSGKNVKKLSLLSGGERSLTALAFLFAVFRSRPSPFYVMDEVEAALDDVNLHRFLDLVAEFRQEAQLVIVSHQKRTMEAAECLYGVTMQPGGSSKVVSEKVAV